MSMASTQESVSSLSSNRHRLARVLGPDLFQALRSLIRLSREDWRTPYPLRQKIKAWSRGFYAASYALYDLEHNKASDYINDFTWVHRCSRLNVSLFYFRHKLAFRSALLHAGVPQPETIAVIAHNRILLNPLSSNHWYVLPDELENFVLADGGKFIVKPEAGNRGEGIFLLSTTEKGLVCQSGRLTKRFTPTDLPAVGLIERVISQGPFWSNLFPGSGNSIRILTGWMPGESQPFIIRAVQRIGTADTLPTDNWSRGSICALIDLNTGRLGPGRVNPSKSKYPNRRYSIHPDSNALIEGAVLPAWQSIREAILHACMSSPFHRYVGWDVIVDEQGTAVVVEANGNSGLGLIQIHGGLLADRAAKLFYQACRVV
jgi:hypothetical protein